MATTLTEPESLILSVAAENGVFTEDMVERAKHDVVFGKLLKCAQNLKKIANNATFKLAEDLYSVDTHFVLECIQNAADNHYKPGVEPLLRICARSDRIQLDCNETGFTPKDIEAICRVGGSNKTSKEGFIGAKGIGFKSVFKIAQEAHIYSPPYSFKFDKGRELGMIIPIWVPEEELLVDSTKDCQTSILLLPPADGDFTEYLKTFKSISPTLLLFLPKLKRLEIIIHEKEAHGGEVITRRNLRSKVDKGDNFIILTVEDSSSPHPDGEHRYRKTTERWKAWEGEKQREGVKISETVLAFPVTSKGVPLESSQHVHAFLPIRDFGFKFVIQADFIVSSNREDIHQSYDWNIYQRACISHAFQKAILGFLQSPHDPLRYTWMRFLPRGIKHPFWKPAEQRIWERIQESEVLESRAKSLHRPDRLERLVEKALDRSGEPLVGSPSEYLAPCYDERDFEVLEKLGVRRISWSFFLTRLCNMTDSELKSKNQQWHEDLAKALCGVEKLQVWPTFSSRVISKTFIPLLNGNNWISAVDLDLNPVYFQEGSGRIKVPSDISPRFVEESASKDPCRKMFFKILGVKDYDQSEAASAILRKHQGSVVPTVTEDEAIAHALYLYDLDSSITNKMDLTSLWLYDEQGRAARGRDLYVRDTSAYGPASLFDGHDTIARFLSSRYSTPQVSQQNKPKFLQWLMRVTGLTNIPRLNRSGTLSPEFDFILRNYPDKLLYILKNFWGQYKNLMAKTSIVDAIKNHPTACFDGQSRTSIPLKDCYVPDSRMKLVSSELYGSLVGPPFLSIEPFNASEWEFLSTFGVGIAPDLSFYLWIGRQRQFQKSCTLDGAKKLLKYIADLTGFEEQKQIQVRSAFKHDKLLLAPLSGNLTFTFPSLCVWKAPQGFRKVASLESLYGGDPSVMSLIRTTLQVEDASIEVVVKDLASNPPSDSYLKESLQYIALRFHSQQDHGSLHNVPDAFRLNPLITVPLSGSGSIRVCSTSCVWGGPRVSHKWNLQPHYETDIELRVLLCSQLDIRPPTLDDLLRELILLKMDPENAVGQTEQIYSYMSENYSGPEIRQRFERDALVCVQSLDGARLWKRPSECVWTAPDFLRCKIPIAERHGFTEASAISLLQNTLSIGNASLTDFIADLRILRDREEFDEDGLEVLYKSIELSIVGHENKVRRIFDEENLVYGHQLDPPRWVKLGDCVWSGPKCLQTITRLARCYPSLDKLFTKYLGVEDATPETVLDELRFIVADFEQKCTTPFHIVPEPLARRVTDLLLAFTFKSFTLSPSIIEALQSGTFWPYQPEPSGYFLFAQITEDIIIPDHEYFLDLFRGKFPVLKLTPTEVKALKPLFVKLGVEDKFLSNCVTEIASANDVSLPAKDLSHELSARARALFCCTEHFSTEVQANRRKGLYQLLKDIQVFRASDISTAYTINAHEIDESVTTKGLMRLDAKGGQLKLFVPRDEHDQKEAFAICLAKELIRFLGLPEAESWHIITAVLAVEPERLDSFLHRQGISNHYSATPLDAEQAKWMTVSLQDETIILDTMFRTLSLSSQQNNSKDNEVSVNALSTSTTTIAQTRSVNSKADINQHPTSSGTTSQVPLDSTNASEPARQEPDPDLPSAIPEFNIENTPRKLASNSGSDEQHDSIRKKKVVQMGTHSKHDSLYWASSPHRGRRLSDISHSTDLSRSRETSTASFDESDAASHSSAITSSSDEAEILNTPSKKTTKTAHRHQIEEALNGTYQAASFSSTRLTESINSTPRGTHGGPEAVGYAGEQFIVDILKTEIEDFDEAKHWTSKLRRHAKIPPYLGEEITDLEYQDRTGCFSRLLRTWTKGEVPNWLEEACMSGPKTRPNYRLEVKTTPGKCETVIFVSPHQYQLMQKYAIDDRDSAMPTDVYVLVRVFNIGGETGPTGVRAYLDPWSEGLKGRLKFDIQYKVTTGH